MCRIKLPTILVIQTGIALVTASTSYKYSGQIGNTGTDDSGDVPCDPDAQVSACCGAGSICLSNLYCYDANITTANVPGTCTDQSFTDPACPCPPTTSLDYTDDVTFCPDGSYCCGNNNTACCSSNSGNLEIFYGNPGTIPSATASLLGYYSSLDVSTKSRSTTISSSPSSTQTPTTASGSTSSTAITPTPTAPSGSTSPTLDTTPTSSTPTASSTSASPNSTGSGGLNEGDKIAIGTIIPVVALVAGFVAWWFLGRRWLHKTANSPEEIFERHSAGAHIPNLFPTGELPSGLDRAELVTKQWDSAELPSQHEVSELADRL